MSQGDRGVTKAAGCGEAAHVTLTQEAENTKPKGFGSRRPAVR